MLYPRNILISLLIAAQLICGLKYPLKDEDILGEGALIPALPRPMTTVSESPFHFLASGKAQVTVYGHIDNVGNEELKKLYLIVFSANTELELENIFLYGYRTRLAFEIHENICDPTFPSSFEELSPGVTSFTRENIKFKGGKLIDALKSKRKRGDIMNFYSNVTIKESGYQYAFVLNCNSEALTITRGTLNFRNPHGYLPGGWYLKLPFSFVVMLAYGGALLVFGIKCLIHRHEISFVQYGVMVVLIMGMFEQLVNFFTFQELNVYGFLPCCPVRTDMAFTMVMSAAKRATLVTFLLFVSLGYGIQRPTLRRKEYTAVAVLGLLYLFAAVNYELAVIAQIDSTGGEDDAGAAPFSTVVSSLFLSFLNMVVIYWIYFSIISVIERLEEEKQEAKKEMYESLVRSLIFWFIIGFIAEGIFYSWLTHKIKTPWKYDMVPKFIWDSLFFLIVLQIGWLWLPSRASRQLAYAQQLPTEDFDDFDPVDDDDTEGGEIELSSVNDNNNAFVIAEKDDNDSDEDSDFK